MFQSFLRGFWAVSAAVGFTLVLTSCGEKPPSRPKGIAGLGIREWTCSDCGSVNDRDLNAARNILARGHSRLAVGIPSLSQ